MSWVRAAVSRPSEDVFDEDADEMHLVQKEWKSRKEGEGWGACRSVSPQQGGDCGWDKLLAHLCFVFLLFSALLSWCHLNGHDSALLSKINDLLHAVGKYEEHVLKCLNSIHTQPHLGELLDSVQDMDLSCTIPAEEEFSGTKSERPCGSGTTFSENCCKSNSEADSVQSEYCQTKKHGDSEGPTFAWVKEQTVCLIKQLGLSWDILQLIQQLES
uniref:Uncharacterized protein n=1 Tax=Crocodylus porosus TaxID=8502 RepID=A0A7M4EYF7_CROPO